MSHIIGHKVELKSLHCPRRPQQYHGPLHVGTSMMDAVISRVIIGYIEISVYLRTGMV